MKHLIKSKGFTLIEIMVALIILSVSLLALASLMAMTTKNNSYGSHVTEAATFAQDKLEELRITPWNSLPSFAGTDQRIGPTGISYARNWTVTPNPPSGTDAIRTVTITVTWNDRINHSIRLLSVISQ